MPQDSSKAIVYIDGENFLHRVAYVLKENGSIGHKTEITDLDFHYIVNALNLDTPIIRYYGTKVRLVRQTDGLKEQTTKIIGTQRRSIVSIAT